MQVQQIQNSPKFTGIINIQGPNPQSAISINTDNLSSIQPTSYYPNLSNWNFTKAEGSEIVMNDSTRINTFLPSKVVVEAYKSAKENGEANLQTPYDPFVRTRSLLYV